MAKVVANKEVTAELKRLRKLGWEQVGTNSSGKPVIAHEQHGRYTLPATPSDHRWLQNTRAEIARRMNITVAEMEERIGGEPVGTRQPAEVRRARRGRGEGSLTAYELLATTTQPRQESEPETPDFTPDDRPLETQIEEKARERQEAWRSQAGPEVTGRLTAELEQLYARVRARGVEDDC